MTILKATYAVMNVEAGPDFSHEHLNATPTITREQKRPWLQRLGGLDDSMKTKGS